jgi:hypothetical protein
MNNLKITGEEEEDFDLNLDNYNLEELLLLFDLTHNFDELQLKKAKKSILKLHPDKCSLDSKYFLFYSKAYKIIYSMYIFKNKNFKKVEEAEYNKDIDENIKIILNKNFKNQTNNEFDNKKFNELYEKYNERMNDGYEDWFRNMNDQDDDNRLKEEITLKTLNEEIEKRKKERKTIVQYKGIENLYFNSKGYSNIDGIDLSNDSGLFSSLNYKDLKEAHTETLIPVTDEDYENIKKFHSINEYQNYRIKDEKEWKFNKFINNNNEEEETNKRAFNIAKQLEESKRRNTLFLNEFQLLDC